MKWISSNFSVSGYALRFFERSSLEQPAAAYLKTATGGPDSPSHVMIRECPVSAYELTADRFGDRMGAIGRPELLRRTLQIAVDGLGAVVGRIGDLLARQPFSREFKAAQFAAGQGKGAGRKRSISGLVIARCIGSKKNTSNSSSLAVNGFSRGKQTPPAAQSRRIAIDTASVVTGP